MYTQTDPLALGEADEPLETSSAPALLDEAQDLTLPTRSPDGRPLPADAARPAPLRASQSAPDSAAAPAPNSASGETRPTLTPPAVAASPSAPPATPSIAAPAPSPVDNATAAPILPPAVMAEAAVISDVSPGGTTTAGFLSTATIETTNRLAARIAQRFDGRATRFELGLTPEGLGRVDVTLEIDRDGQVTAKLAFDNPLAAAELRARADDLRRQLQEAGFTVGQDALSFSERDPGTGSGFGQAFERDRGRAYDRGLSATVQADTATPPSPSPIPSRTGLDMKV